MKKGNKKTKKQAKKTQGKKGKAAPAKKKTPKQKEKKAVKKEKAPAPNLDALRKPVEEAKAALTASEVEAQTLEGQAKEIRTQAKDVFRDTLAPYREACRKAGVECEFGGTRSPNVAKRVSFLVEKVKNGIRVMIKGRPKTDEVIPFKVLKESVNKAAYAYTDKHLGPREEIGNKGGGLSNRLRAVLAEK